MNGLFLANSIQDQEKVAYILADHYKQDPEIFMTKPAAVLFRMYEHTRKLMGSGNE